MQLRLPSSLRSCKKGAGWQRWSFVDHTQARNMSFLLVVSQLQRRNLKSQEPWSVGHLQSSLYFELYHTSDTIQSKQSRIQENWLEQPEFAKHELAILYRNVIMMVNARHSRDHSQISHRESSSSTCTTRRRVAMLVSANIFSCAAGDKDL